MTTYNVQWSETERTDEAGHNTLADRTEGLTLDEVRELAVSCAARATLRNEQGFKVGEVSPAGEWQLS